MEGYFDVAHVFEWGDRDDVVVLAFWSGGASCCHSYQIVHLTDHGEFATPIFGEYGLKTIRIIRMRTHLGWPLARVSLSARISQMNS